MSQSPFQGTRTQQRAGQRSTPALGEFVRRQITELQEVHSEAHEKAVSVQAL